MIWQVTRDDFDKTTPVESYVPTVSVYSLSYEQGYPYLCYEIKDEETGLTISLEVVRSSASSVLKVLMPDKTQEQLKDYLRKQDPLAVQPFWSLLLEDANKLRPLTIQNGSSLTVTLGPYKPVLQAYLYIPLTNLLAHEFVSASQLLNNFAVPKSLLNAIKARAVFREATVLEKEWLALLEDLQANASLSEAYAKELVAKLTVDDSGQNNKRVKSDIHLRLASLLAGNNFRREAIEVYTLLLRFPENPYYAKGLASIQTLQHSLEPSLRRTATHKLLQTIGQGTALNHGPTKQQYARLLKEYASLEDTSTSAIGLELSDDDLGHSKDTTLSNLCLQLANHCHTLQTLRANPRQLAPQALFKPTASSAKEDWVTVEGLEIGSLCMSSKPESSDLVQSTKIENPEATSSVLNTASKSSNLSK